MKTARISLLACQIICCAGFIASSQSPRLLWGQDNPPAAKGEPGKSKEPAAKEPAAKEPAAKEPAAKEPAAKEPAAKGPAAKEPAAKEPAAKEPAAKEPAAKEPAAKATEKAASAPEAPADAKEPADAAASKGADSGKPGPAFEAYQKSLAEWKVILKGLREQKIKYANTRDTSDDAKKKDENAAAKKQIEAEWDALIAKGVAILPLVRKHALAAYQEVGNRDPQLEKFLVKLSADALESDDYEPALELSKTLLENGGTDARLPVVATISAICAGDFATAGKYEKAARESGKLADLPREMTDCLARLTAQKKAWEKEAKIREAEAAKNDLPRVQITTNRGTMVAELFENEAPETVANFISLVDKGFYNGKTFHRVVPHFVAQGGDPEGKGTGGPGYSIYCECYKENYRQHFRGSLSMAHAGRDTGGSQFFITLIPASGLDGQHTCFGRVIEGMDVLAKLQRRDPSALNAPTPDKIVEAKVLRKREHPYAPRKVAK